jgi:imidazolonepropionase-like amidohydrolase
MGCILNNARVIDGKGNVRDGLFVALEGSKIREIGARASLPETARVPVIDLAGHTVMPGVIDCHVHLSIDGGADVVSQVARDSAPIAALRMARNAERTLRAGITTVRDCGAKDHIDIEFRRAVAEGIHPATPRLLLSGMPIAMTGGHCWQFGREADGADEVRRAAREQIKVGADCIKLMATGGILTEGTEIGSAQLGEEEMRAAVEEAEKAGKLSAIHAHGATGIKNGLRAGIRSVEHAYLLDDEAIELMLKRGAWLVPTAAAVGLVVRHGRAAGIPASVVRKAESALESQRSTCRKAWRAGVKLAMGTDAGTPYNRHGENLQELAVLVEIGLTPMEAIVASTLRSAELLGLADSIGTIEAGKEADLLVLAGDPLADIGILAGGAATALVVKGGKLAHFGAGMRDVARAWPAAERLQ